MKKTISFLIAIVLILSCQTTVLAQDEELVFSIGNEDNGHSISNVSYGVAINDENFAVNGGLVSNLVADYSFENSEHTVWVSESLELTTEKGEQPLYSVNPTYATLSVSGNGFLRNLGYIEPSADSVGDMGFVQGEKYDFSCYVRNIDFDGMLCVFLDSPNNSQNEVQLDISNSKGKWKKLTTTLEASNTEDGALAIALDGSGSICVDFVTLVPHNSYGYGSESRMVTVRNDFYTSLLQLHPAYVYFCADNWRDNIGVTEQRVGSKLMGCHEYLQLCADLNTLALPMMSADVADISSKEWTAFVQEVSAFIEYANGDANTSYYGALRSANGSVEPFNLKYIAVDANDNCISALEKALGKYDIDIISCSSLGIEGADDKTGNKSFTDFAVKLITLESDGNEADKILFRSAFERISDKPLGALAGFDSQELVLTADYYTQMLFANNTGDRYVDSSFANGQCEQNGVYASTTADEENQVLYVKLVNTSGEKQSARLSLNGYDTKRISVQSISAYSQELDNATGSNTIYPVETELECSNAPVVELDKYEVAVVRIAYGSNDGSMLYALPELIATVSPAERYVPAIVKYGIPIGAGIGVVLIAVAIKLIASSNKKKRKAKDD